MATLPIAEGILQFALQNERSVKRKRRYSRDFALKFEDPWYRNHYTKLMCRIDELLNSFYPTLHTEARWTEFWQFSVAAENAALLGVQNLIKFVEKFEVTPRGRPYPKISKRKCIDPYEI